MNTERLKEIIEILLEKEKEFTIQNKLQDVNTHLSNMVNQPEQKEHQNSFMEARTALSESLTEMEKAFDPVQMDLFKEIGAHRFFSTNIEKEISSSVSKNSIAPAVVLGDIQKIQKERKDYINTVTQISNNFEKIGVKAKEVETEEGEIGFLLPRDIFDNQLDGLIKQLREINILVRIFSETATGSGEKIEVRQISTTDPIFFFGLTFVTLKIIGRTVLWALKVWEKVEAIRHLRLQNEQSKLFTKEELALYDNKIKEIIEKASNAKIKELLEKGSKLNKRPKTEQAKGLELAIEKIFYLIENGAKIEVKAIAPIQAKDSEEENEANLSADFKEVKKLQMQLKFPKAQGQGILKLPPPFPKSLEKNKKEPTSSKPKTVSTKPAPKSKKQ